MFRRRGGQRRRLSIGTHRSDSRRPNARGDIHRSHHRPGQVPKGQLAPGPQSRHIARTHVQATGRPATAPECLNTSFRQQATRRAGRANANTRPNTLHASMRVEWEPKSAARPPKTPPFRRKTGRVAPQVRNIHPCVHRNTTFDNLTTNVASN